MNTTKAYIKIANIFQECGRQVHCNPRRGVFLRSIDLSGYHDLCFTDYRSTSGRGLLPRLTVNTDWASKRLPKTVAKKWGSKSESFPLHGTLNLELTFLPVDLDGLAASMPTIIDFIEAGNREGFERLLPYETTSFGCLNIWSVAAISYERTGEWTEQDPPTLVTVKRGENEIGKFYLSHIELLLKQGEFSGIDCGIVIGMPDWIPLPALAKSLRLKNGEKRRATSGQRAFLKRCNCSTWKGMSNGEASRIIENMNAEYGFSPGHWITLAATEEQKNLLRDLGVEYLLSWTRGETSLVISKFLNDR